MRSTLHNGDSPRGCYHGLPTHGTTRAHAGRRVPRRKRPQTPDPAGFVNPDHRREPPGRGWRVLSPQRRRRLRAAPRLDARHPRHRPASVRADGGHDRRRSPHEPPAPGAAAGEAVRPAGSGRSWRALAPVPRLAEQLRCPAPDAVLGTLVLRRHPVHRRPLALANPRRRRHAGVDDAHPRARDGGGARRRDHGPDAAGAGRYRSGRARSGWPGSLSGRWPGPASAIRAGRASRWAPSPSRVSTSPRCTPDCGLPSGRCANWPWSADGRPSRSPRCPCRPNRSADSSSS